MRRDVFNRSFWLTYHSHKPVIRAVGVLCPKWVGEVNGKLGAIDFVYLTICHSDCFNCVGKTFAKTNQNFTATFR